MKTIINTTPHNVNICDANSKVINTFLKSDNPIRLNSVSNQIGDINGIPVNSVAFGSANLPAFQEGIYYIVSALVKNAFPNRPDLLVPHDVVRDEGGNIIGCRSFSV